MNSVLGCESELIDLSVRNAVESTLKSTLPHVAGTGISTGTNDTITFNNNSTGVNSLVFNADANVGPIFVSSSD